MKSIHDALTALYRHAEEHMPTEELQDVACVLTTEAEEVALNLSEIVGGLASLIHEDGQCPGRCGCFQDAESVFPLLWGISQQFNHLAALIRVGNDARYESFSRKAAAAAPEQPKKSGVKA